MTQVSYPGVYIQEVPSGVHTITGVSTSIAAFLGRTSKGPINKAVRILSLADYARKFGNPHPQSDLADSVRLFFANGGTDCYVIRLAKGAEKASVHLRSLAGVEVLTATAKAEGSWANTLRLVVDYDTPNPDESFNLRVILEDGGQVTATETFVNLNMDRSSPRFAPSFVKQSSDLITLDPHPTFLNEADLLDPAALAFVVDESFPGFSQSRRPMNLGEMNTVLGGLITGSPAASKYNISVNGSAPATVDLAPWDNPTSEADFLSFFFNRIDPAIKGVDPNLEVQIQLPTISGRRFITIVANEGGVINTTVPNLDVARASVTITRASSNDISAALMLGLDQGGIEPVRWSNFRPAPTVAFLQIGDPAPGGSVTAVTSIIDDIANLDASAPDVDSITVDSAAITLSAAPYDVTIPEDSWFKSEPVPDSPHGDSNGVREKLRRIAGAINAEPTLDYTAEVWGYHLAIRANSGTPSTVATTIDTGHADFDDDEFAFNVRQYAMGISGTGNFSLPGDTGIDGTVPKSEDYMGSQVDQIGFYALDSVDIFNLMVLPGDEEIDEVELSKMIGPASNYCTEKRAFLLVDGPPSWTKNGRPEVVQDKSKIDAVRSLVVKDHSAVFYPRLEYSAGGPSRLIGPSGAIAGLMARIDSTRGVWKAPAGLEADIRGILGLELKLTDLENGVLNKQGVNCLRVFPSGFVNWGARTLAGSDDQGSEWKYIPIRRMALFLEESLFRGTKWVVFEPNDEPLWAKIRLNLNAFMMGLFRQGAFQGSTPNEAFYVKCDAETTTQADRNLGIVNIEVGFAPLKPAEFVVIKIQQIAGDL